jgi:hypothetical protein
MTREEMYKRLENQYLSDYAGNGFKNEFKPDGGMVECNFGGKLIILSNDGDSCLVWSDWADSAVSESLTECEIEFQPDEDDPDGDLVSGFNMGGTFYRLDEFMRIDN